MEKLTIRIEKERIEGLDKLAKEKNVTRSFLVRMAVLDYLSREYRKERENMKKDK